MSLSPVEFRHTTSICNNIERVKRMNQFQSTEDIRIFCGFLIQLATDIGDEKARLLLQEALAAGNTSSPTERLGETIEGLLVVREIMLRDDRYSVDVIYEVNEAIKTGQKMLRRANRPWFFWLFLISLRLFPSLYVSFIFQMQVGKQ